MQKFLIITLLLLLSLTIGCSKKNEKPKSSKTVEKAMGIDHIKRGETIKKQLKEFEKSQQEREKELEKIE